MAAAPAKTKAEEAEAPSLSSDVFDGGEDVFKRGRFRKASVHEADVKASLEHGQTRVLHAKNDEEIKEFQNSLRLAGRHLDCIVKMKVAGTDLVFLATRKETKTDNK